MGELVPRVPVPPQTLGPPPVCRDTDEKVGQPAGALIADLRVQGHLPLVVHSALVAAVETDKVMEVLQGRGEGVELVRELIKRGILLFCLREGGRDSDSPRNQRKQPEVWEPGGFGQQSLSANAAPRTSAP